MTAESKLLTTVLSCTIILGCSRASSGSQAAPDEPGSLPPGKAPQLPKASPLAESRSTNQVGLPAQLTQSVIPRDNPLTPEKIKLGQKLFFDGRLSADGTVACATCHDPARAFT